MNNLKLTEMFGEYRSGYAVNRSYEENVIIHFIEKNEQKENRLSVIVSPGLWEPAERSIPLFEELDCHCVSLSYRGRGKSDTPVNGYDLEHHVSDFKTVIDTLNIKSFVIVAFSRGVGYACSYVLQYSGKVKGMVIVDHPPIHVKPNPGYSFYWKNLIYLGNPITKYMRPEALDRLEAEAGEVIFWEELNKFNFPVTILRGTGKESKIVSDLTEEDMKKYRKYLKSYKEINFEYSGHMIVDEELGKYRRTVREFVESLNNGNNK